MSVHERLRPPAGHGEVVCCPPFSEWEGLARANAEAVRTWPAEYRALREQARAEAIEAAHRYSASIGISGGGARGDLIVMTGHQPELFHPGVWVKHFLIQRFSEDVGALGIDIVVDTDEAASVVMRAPCLDPVVKACSVELTPGSAGRAYAQVPVPDGASRRTFRIRGLDLLEALPAPALARHFATFCDALDAQAASARDLAALVTGARRAYERPAGTDYLELSMSDQAATPSFRAFVARILTDAGRFRDVFNRELSAYRRRTGTRSAAQPFPDLKHAGSLVETPFWLLGEEGRQATAMSADGVLHADGEPVLALGGNAKTAAAALGSAGIVLVPRGIALTLYERLFVADLFVHGTGGGRYDRVTDAVIRSYFGVDAPSFAVASMTLMLPLGGRIVTDEDVAAAERRLKRFEHNPDELLDDVEFDTLDERAAVERLVERKRALTREIAAEGADRKSLGFEIRETNRALAGLLADVGAEFRAELDAARSARDASGVLTDRTYPFCLWDPREVGDKVR